LRLHASRQWLDSGDPGAARGFHPADAGLGAAGSLDLVFFATLAIVGAAAGGEWIARSIAQLTAAARTIGSGEFAVPVATNLREVNDLGEALSRASRDRQRAEAAMRESDTRFRAIVDQNTAGISIVDLDGHFRLANPRPLRDHRLFGGRVRTKTLIDITHRTTGRRISHCSPHDELRHELYDREAIHPPRRRVVWVQVSSVAVRNSAGVPPIRHRPRPRYRRTQAG